MNHFKSNISIILILFLFTIFALNLLNIVFYKSVIDLSLFNVLLFMFITLIFINVRRDRIFPKSLIIYLIIVIALFLTYFLALPKYSYKKAVMSIQDDMKQTNIIIMNNDSKIKNIELINDKSFFIKRGYVIKVKNKSEYGYYVFNPINGMYYYNKKIY